MPHAGKEDHWQAGLPLPLPPHWHRAEYGDRMIRVAIVGTSSISYQFAQAVTRVPGMELAGVCSRSADKAAGVAAELGAPSHWGSLEDLLADNSVDAVYVASPNSVHYGQALAAIAAGKHVLVEKPAVATAAQFQDLLTRAAEKQVLVFEAMRNVYDPGMQRIRELLPRLGELRSARFDFSQRSSRYDLVLEGQTVNIFDPEMAGGALYDLGVYCIAALVELLGVPTGVTARSVLLPTGADGLGSILASYPGLVAHLSYSKITSPSQPCQIQGELGTVTFDSVAAPRHLTVEMLDGTRESIDLPGSADNMEFELRRFVELVSGANPVPDNQRTLDTLVVLDRARASSARSD